MAWHEKRYGDDMDTTPARLLSHVPAVLGAEHPPTEVIVSWGSPFLQIIDHAIARHADLIVIGTHGHTGVRRMMLGSVAEKTVRLAPCPVLTVHDSAALGRTLGEPAPTGRAHPSDVPVASVMRRDPIVVDSHATLDVVNARMLEASLRHIPVVDDGRPVGIVTDRDLQPFVGQLRHTRVEVVMTPNPVTVTGDTPISAAARRMIEERVRALPVVEGSRLIGILTTTDILEDYVLTARE